MLTKFRQHIRIGLIEVAIAVVALVSIALATGIRLNGWNGSRMGVPAEQTPGIGATSIYAVINPNPVDIDIRHTITNTTSFHYEFRSKVPAKSTIEFHVRDMPDIPSHFTGAVTLESDQPFSARVIGYDSPP